MKKSVLIIGGGIAGMEAARCLSDLEIHVTLIEREKELGGHLRKWDRLFPNRRPANEVLDALATGLDGKVSVKINTKINKIKNDDHNFFVILENGESLKSDVLLLTTGFELFDAVKKEEYGYNIYDNVVTSADIEEIFRSGTPLLTAAGNIPKRIGIVHCVGSRDEKAGNLYCSKVCCVTGVKQAIGISEALPQSEVFSFYMDLRMYDRYFEDLYLEAQQKHGIRFIRGRLSEACENPDHSILIKVEDTLTGKPLKMNVDLLVLLVGFVPSKNSASIGKMMGLIPGEDGFLTPVDPHLHSNSTSVPGLFLAGAVKGPVTIENTISDARAAAVQIAAYLR